MINKEQTLDNKEFLTFLKEKFSAEGGNWSHKLTGRLVSLEDVYLLFMIGR